MGSKDQAIQEIERRYQQHLLSDTDQQHVRILKQYGMQCQTITEIGFRGGVSASAFLAAQPKKFTAIDWDREPFRVDREVLSSMRQQAEDAGIEFNFISDDSLEVRIEDCELLFIDGFHTYEHLFLELIRHNNSVSRFILLHDTDEQTCPGMFPAVEDFLLDALAWRLEARHRERPGLTVLKRVAHDPFLVYPRVLIRTLEHAVSRQKQMYYDQIDQSGSSNSQWHDHVWRQVLKFSDKDRWPLSNRATGATEMVADRGSTHQTES